MSKHAFLLLLTAVLTPTPLLGGGDDLFSDVRPLDVFSDAAETGSPAGERIVSADQMRDLLNAAGFDAKSAGERAVVLKKELDRWSFPVLLNLSEDEQHVAIVLGLRTIKDRSELTADILLKMMAASRRRAPVVLTYSETRERTEACVVLRNANLTGQILRDEINRIAIAARDEAKLWSAPEKSEEQAPSTDESTTSARPSESPDVSNPSTVLLGRWSAAKSATEAFAIEFKSDATFRLVYVNNGKQTLSNGRFEIKADQLTLDGTDGLKLVGQLKIASDTEFRFTPGNGTELKFQKAAR